MNDNLLAAPEGSRMEALGILLQFYGLLWVVPWLLMLLLALLAFCVWYFFLAPRAETKVAKLAVFQKLLPFSVGDGYHLRHNLPLLGEGVGKVNTDFVLFSPYGIFVMESKGLSGFIVGDEDDDKWRRARGKAFQRRTFANPLRRSQDNIAALQKMTGLPEHCFHPVVVVADDTHFQSPMPHNVVPVGDLADFIAAREEAILTPEQVAGAITAVAAGKQGTDMIENLRDYYLQDTAQQKDEVKQ